MTATLCTQSVKKASVFVSTTLPQRSPHSPGTDPEAEQLRLLMPNAAI